MDYPINEHEWDLPEEFGDTHEKCTPKFIPKELKSRLHAPEVSTSIIRVCDYLFETIHFFHLPGLFYGWLFGCLVGHLVVWLGVIK
jgi:hypothetical protein